MRPIMISLPVLAALSACAPAANTDIAAALREEIDRMRIAYEVNGVGVAVVQDDRVLLAEGFGRFADGMAVGATSPCTLFSATKALTAFTLASLIDDGELDLEVRLGDALPGAPPAWRAIPVWRLYNHTSGLPMIVNQPGFGAIADNPQAGNGEIFEIIREQPLDYAPGAYSRYRQSGYAIAELVAQAATGQSWPALVDAHLTGPAGAPATVHGPLSDGEKEAPLLTSAGFYRTTPRDMGAIFLALNAGRVAPPDRLEATLLDPAYVQDGYGLGLIHEQREGVATIGHRGGGGRANIRYAPSAKIGVMACTDQQPNEELTLHIADMALGALLTGSAPKPDIAVALFEAGASSGAALTALLDAEKARMKPRFSFAFEQASVNRVGYAHLEAGRLDQALALFSHNTDSFPRSANAWDSLADAQEAAQDLTAARDSLRRAAALAPENTRLQNRLAQLEAASP